jgi:hypothetical protein
MEPSMIVDGDLYAAGRPGPPGGASMEPSMIVDGDSASGLLRVAVHGLQ